MFLSKFKCKCGDSFNEETKRHTDKVPCPSCGTNVYPYHYRPVKSEVKKAKVFGWNDGKDKSERSERCLGDEHDRNV